MSRWKIFELLRLENISSLKSLRVRACVLKFPSIATAAVDESSFGVEADMTAAFSYPRPLHPQPAAPPTHAYVGGAACGVAPVERAVSDRQREQHPVRLQTAAAALQRRQGEKKLVALTLCY